VFGYAFAASPSWLIVEALGERRLAPLVALAIGARGGRLKAMGLLPLALIPAASRSCHAPGATKALAGATNRRFGDATGTGRPGRRRQRPIRRVASRSGAPAPCR